MTKQQLKQALSLMNFVENEHYTIDEDYDSIEVSEGLDKPSLLNLQMVYSDWNYRTTLGSRIQALGDIGSLISLYLANKPEEPDGAFNLAGFEPDKIDTPFGWHFKECAKPSISQLEAMVMSRTTQLQQSQMAAIRKERNRKLSECDWTQLPDAPLSSSQKTAWQTYRQELRDFTETVDLNNIQWPEAP